MDIQPIAHIHTPFPTKFGVPRQPELVASAVSRLVFEPAFRDPDAVRGLEGFDYVWLVWAFSRNLAGGMGCVKAPAADGGDDVAAPCVDNQDAGTETDRPAPSWRPTVRPPRLGGTRRVGVFATRSSYRPNGLAISSLQLLRVDLACPEAPVLELAGADMVDGTPVFDVKPYLPYADAHPQARSGWAGEAPWPAVAQVDIPPDLEGRIPVPLRAPMREVLAQDPRPAYTRSSESCEGRVFWVPLENVVCRFTVGADQVLRVVDVEILGPADMQTLRQTGTVPRFEPRD